MKLDLKKLINLKRKKKLPKTAGIAILDENSSFTVKEAYKSLRTNLVFSMGTPNGKAKVLSIVVTTILIKILMLLFTFKSQIQTQKFKRKV